ncbi:MAG TPA: GMC family oxidoreductase [Gemmatimonadales bacterium]|nr:GMC family oxidoreductase [Gemmatimonadales bacterium]
MDRAPVLRALAETFVPGSDAVNLAERMGETIAALPHRGDRDELLRLLGLLESRAVNAIFAGIPRPFTAMSTPERERYLRDWATSRLPLRRKAFQALKRIATVIYYTSRDPSGRANPSWPRLGYPGPLGPPPATPKPIRPLEIARDETLRCDVVVVGSGAGGGVVAGELAARGADVVVLERGGYYNEADFTHYEGEALGRLYDAGGLLTSDDLSFVLLQGSCLGGGTVVNYTTSFHTPDAVRTQWAREHALPHFTSPEYTASLDAVARRIGVTVDAHRPSTRDAAMIRGLEALGWHHGLLPRDVRECPQDEECGYCGYGCRRGAKQSTLRTYLEDAAQRGARIIVNAHVDRVTIEWGRATGVSAVVRSANGDRPYSVAVRAKAVVVAGGSLHSPALLLRSGVARPALGRHLALHPGAGVFGLMPEETRPWTGTLQAHYSDQFVDLDHGYGFKFETVPVHPSLFALAVPWESGIQHSEAMAGLSRTTLVAILLRDRDGGRVRVDAEGQPVVSYQLSRYDAGHLRRGFAEGSRLLEAAGAQEIWASQAQWISYRPDANAMARRRWLDDLDRAGFGPNQIQLASFHQMASCRMGGRAEHAVVDPENQVWGIPGLYVADASTFPSSSGVNPMLTVMGIAHRAAGCIAAKL